VLNPAILLHGSVGNIIISFILVSISIITISYSLEGYLPKFGLMPIWMRATLFLGGLCIGFPWYKLRLIGSFIIAASLISGILINKLRE